MIDLAHDRRLADGYDAQWLEMIMTRRCYGASVIVVVATLEEAKLATGRHRDPRWREALRSHRHHPLCCATKEERFR